MDQNMDLKAWHQAITALKETLDEMMTAPKIFHSLPLAIKIEAGDPTRDNLVCAHVQSGAATSGCAGLWFDAGVIHIKTMEAK